MIKKNFINFVYAFGSNIITLIVSVIVTLILPKAISVNEYALIQLYTFYSVYIGVFGFGLPEGMLINYAGTDYSRVDKSLLGKQVQLLTALECVLVIIGMLGCIMCIKDPDKRIVFSLCTISFLAIIPRLLILNVLQATSRFKEYAKAIVIEKSAYLIISVVLILMGVSRFYWYVVAIIIGYILSTIYCVYQTIDLFQCLEKISLLERRVIKECLLNMRVGIKILFATLSSSLVVGIVRIGIEVEWDVETFGKLSLTISIANLLMVFVSAVATIMLPTLRKTDVSIYEKVYNVSRCCIMTALLSALLAYYPIKELLSAWLPEYSESLRYMALLFPMCVYSSKSSMLIEPYLKNFHKEKWLLLINVMTVLLSAITTFLTTFWLHNLDLAVVSIVFLLAFRCVFAELMLSKVMDINVKTDIVLELCLTIIFIGASWYVGGMVGLSIYAVAYLAYLFIKRKDVAFVANTALRLLRRS